MASREGMDSESSDRVFSIDSLQALLNELWNARSEWYNIGLGLGLSADELKSINQKERKPGDCLREVLIEWLKKRNPRKSQLIEALRQPCVGYEQLADDLHTWVPPANATQNDNHMVSSASMTSEGAANTISDQKERVVELSDGELENLEYRITKDVTEIHEKFATLQTQIRESLSRKDVCAKKVAAHVISYGIVPQTCDEKLKFLKHDTLEEVFSILSDHWSFLDYDLLKSIVKNYGNKDEESIIEKYQKQLKLFCKRRVSEVPKEFIQNKSEHDLHDKVIIKLNRDHPRLKDIKDLKTKVCDVMSIEPATLQIVDVRHGCVEVIFLVSKHISYVFERPLTKQQWEAFQSASIVCLSYGALQLIFVKPNFEAVISYIEKELERDHELLDKLISVSDEQKKLTPSGQDFLMKVKESGWIAPDNLTPLYDRLERANRHDIVHKARLEGLVHGDFAEFEEREKNGQCKEVFIADLASKLKGGISQYCVKENIKQASIPEKDIKDLVNQNINFDCMEQDSVSDALSYVISIKSDATFHHATTTCSYRCKDRSTFKADMSKRVKEGVSNRLATGIPFAGFFYGLLAGLIAILFTQDGLYHTVAEIILAGVLAGVITITVIDHIRDINDINIMLLFQHFFFITIVFLMLVCPPIVIIALVENLTSASAGATVGDYGRAAAVGLISGAAIAIFDTKVARTLVRVAVNYTYILLIASILFQAIFGIYILISILAATAGAYIGAAICIGIIGCVLGGSSEDINDMVRTVSKAIAFGAFIGASIGALTGIVSGAIIGSIVGAIISESDSVNAGLLEIFTHIEPYSISIRLITRPIRAVLKILGPIANIIKVIVGFITSRRTTVFRVVGAATGAIVGGYAGVIGGACIGVIIAGFTAGLFSIGSYFIEKLGIVPIAIGGAILTFGSLVSEFRQHIVIPVLKDIGTVVDIAVLFIFAGIVSAVILSTICALASSYFITSALIGTFGPYVSHFIGNVIVLSETITGDLNIASSGFTGGLLGGIIIGIYRTKAANNQHITEYEIYALGAIGAITGFITTRIDEVVGNALLTNVGIPVGGAALGAFAGLLGGSLLVIVKVPMEMLTKTAATKVGGLIVTITTVIGGFIGGIIGGYFSFSAIFAGLLGIAFSATSVVILTVIVFIRQKRDIHIPLNDIIKMFGVAIQRKRNAANNNWVQYKIKCN